MASSSEPHHRHHHPPAPAPAHHFSEKGEDPHHHQLDPPHSSSLHQHHEGTPLMIMGVDRHLSIMVDPEQQQAESSSSGKRRIMMVFRGRTRFLIFLLSILLVLLWLTVSRNIHARHRHRYSIIPIEHAHEHWLDIGEEMELWFRTWGNPRGGIPVLFVHGGPGNAIEDYHNENKKFFDSQTFYVVEVDQRGTGKSQPSVRDDWHNMQFYKNISIDQICNDFELIRKELYIDQWLVWGGSFGSTISIRYGSTFPESCLGLILRGIYLDTAEEVDAVYSRSTYLEIPHRLAEFDILHNYAAKHANKDELSLLKDPDNAEGLLRIYERLIKNGDRYATWHWHVFENNLMEEDPQNILDPNKIDKKFFPEAQSVAFFETRLWLHGSYEHPSNLMDHVSMLKTIPLWVCQGLRDEVCPPRYAKKFVTALEKEGKEHNADLVTSRFVDSGHEQSDPVMAECLQVSMHEFIQQQSRNKI